MVPCSSFPPPHGGKWGRLPARAEQIPEQRPNAGRTEAGQLLDGCWTKARRAARPCCAASRRRPGESVQRIRTVRRRKGLPLRSRRSPYSLVIRGGDSGIQAKLLSGLSLITFFEASVCSPLCSTTRFSRAAECGRLLHSVTFCCLLLPRAGTPPWVVTNGYLRLLPVYKLFPGVIFEAFDACAAGASTRRGVACRYLSRCAAPRCRRCFLYRSAAGRPPHHQ